MIEDDSSPQFMVESLPWMQLSACRGADPNLFILERGVSAREGRKFCDNCTVQDECYEYGVRTGSVGLFGGVVLSWRRAYPPTRVVQDARPVRVGTPKRRRHKPATQPVPAPMAARKHTG